MEVTTTISPHTVTVDLSVMQNEIQRLTAQLEQCQAHIKELENFVESIDHALECPCMECRSMIDVLREKYMEK